MHQSSDLFDIPRLKEASARVYINLVTLENSEDEDIGLNSFCWPSDREDRGVLCGRRVSAALYLGDDRAPHTE
jgi:hypothetical protein